jgi:hypothetical protein
VNVALAFSATGKTAKTAAAQSDGLPASTATVVIRFINPATDADVVAPTTATHTAGQTSLTVTIANVPLGSWVMLVQALDATSNPIGYFHSTVGVTSTTPTVTVNTSVDVSSLAVAPSTASIAAGASQRFVATATFSDASTENVNAIATWTVSDSQVASVDRGTARGLSAGTSLVSALLSGKSTSATLNVSGAVSPSPSPSASPGQATLVGTSVCAQCHTAGPYANYYAAGDPIDGNTASVTFMDARAYGSIYNNYVASVHSTPAGTSNTDVVTCEGCHGPGSQHYGVGPIPNYMPSIAQCGGCHDSANPSAALNAQLDTIDLAGLKNTAHANPSNAPDKFFFQGGVGTTQASTRPPGGSSSQPEFADLAGTVPVSKNQHIEECSVCHSSDQKASHIAKGDVQDPPQVGCASCHDPHAPADAVRNYVATRPLNGNPGPVPANLNVTFKPVQVNNTLTYGPAYTPVNGLPIMSPYGTSQTYTAGAQFGSTNKNGGTWIRPRLAFAYHVGGDAAQTFSGYANQNTAGDWLRTTPERLCAGCHTQGTYKYGKLAGSTPLTNTHQSDVYTQYRFSAHAAKTDGPWLEFSLLDAPGAAPTYTGSGHRPHYPYDMGGKAGQDGYSGANAFDGTTEFDPNTGKGIGANNFACYQCHNGIGSIDYIKGTVGGTAIGDTQDTHVIWGDSTPTCITCHDPHASGTNNTKNVRSPKWLSYNPEFRADRTPNGLGNKRGAVNLFQDLSPIPANVGNSIICLFCHQGRESGWTAWNKVRVDRMTAGGDQAQAAADFWYNFPNTKINASKFSFVNDHYLAAGSLLYGRNSTEFLTDANGNPARYSDGIPKHLAQNCTGCHMSNPGTDGKTGGHTFVPVVKTCQQCHAGLQSFHDIFAPEDWAGIGSQNTVYNELGTVTPIAWSQAAGVFGRTDGTGGTGLFGLLNQALYDAGIRYDPDAYPYFYKATYNGTTGASFTTFTPNVLAVCQNINQLFKTGGTNTQAVYVHNPQYAAQILIDSIATLRAFTTTNAWITGGAAVPAANPKAGYTVDMTRPTGYTDVSGGTPTLHSGRDYRLPAFDNNGNQTRGYNP